MTTGSRVRVVALSLAIMPFLAGCASKGFVRRSISTERASVDSAMTDAITGERMAREGADTELRNGQAQLRSDQQALRADIEALRRDLVSLRNDFNVEITALKEGLKFSMPVSFNFDDANVREADKPVLDRFAGVVNNHYAGSKITVEGFADPAGAASYNMALSKRRADNVATYLTGKGVPKDFLTSIGYGESRQVVPGASGNRAGAEMNRRVVFVIESRPGDIAMNEIAVIPPTF